MMGGGARDELLSTIYGFYFIQNYSDNTAKNKDLDSDEDINTYYDRWFVIQTVDDNRSLSLIRH